MNLSVDTNMNMFHSIPSQSEEATEDKPSGCCFLGGKTAYMQKICCPMVLTCGRDQIHFEVAVFGLK